MLFFYVGKKVCPVFRLVTTKAFVITIDRCCNDVGEQEIKTKHDKDKRFHDDRLEIWLLYENRKRPAGAWMHESL